MSNYFIAVGAILVFMLGWIGVQQLARAFARRHPEFGPLREEGKGCGSGCACSHGGCRTRRD